jgi:heat-inducible transcriptional repressor
VLTERRESLLGLVVDEYVATALPVSSRALVSRHRLGVSPATVRNELAKLEDEGYITHPHTSAGRVPSDRGYRYYVEVLMTEEPLQRDEARTIAHQFHQAERNLDEWLTLAAAVLASAVTNAVVVTRPRSPLPRIRNVQLVQLRADAALLVVVMDDGAVRERVLPLVTPAEQAELHARAEHLGEHVTGSAAARIRRVAESIEEPELAAAAIAVAELAEEHRSWQETFLEGLPALLAQPEFATGERMLDAVRRLESYEVGRLLEVAEPAAAGDTRVVIGSENPDSEMQDWSVVVSRYGDDDAIGTLAVVGPTRMHYERTIPRVRFVAALMGSLLHESRA